jgi:hypothetical protein
MNNETMALLESVGVKFDLTIEPGKKAKPTLNSEELHTGSLPDYMRTPTLPYRPSRQDFRKESRAEGRGLWVIPLSTGRLAGRFSGLKRAARALRILSRYEAIELNLGIEGPVFQGVINRLLDRRGKLYLATVVRTDIGIHALRRANMDQNVNYLLSHPLKNRFNFVRPEDAIKMLG